MTRAPQAEATGRLALQGPGPSVRSLLEQLRPADLSDLGKPPAADDTQTEGVH